MLLDRSHTGAVGLDAAGDLFLARRTAWFDAQGDGGTADGFCRFRSRLDALLEPRFTFAWNVLGSISNRRSPFFTSWLFWIGTRTSGPDTRGAIRTTCARTRPSRVHGEGPAVARLNLPRSSICFTAPLPVLDAGYATSAKSAAGRSLASPPKPLGQTEIGPERTTVVPRSVVGMRSQSIQTPGKSGGEAGTAALTSARAACNAASLVWSSEVFSTVPPSPLSRSRTLSAVTLRTSTKSAAVPG